jgi:DNA-binding transcriptional LysR family regulator
VGKELTLDTYTELPHLEIDGVPGSSAGGPIDRALAAIGKRRRVSLHVPYYLLTPHILALTDYVATLPASGAEMLVRMAPLRMVSPPLALPSYTYSLIWQHSLDDNRAHAWLRQRIASICEQLPALRIGAA